jgi:hypothetical protein
MVCDYGRFSKAGTNLKMESELMWSALRSGLQFLIKLLTVQAASVTPIEEACGEGPLISRTPNTGFLAHVAERFASVSLDQGCGIITEAGQFEAELAAGQKANDEDFFDARKRTSKELGEDLKLSEKKLG